MPTFLSGTGRPNYTRKPKMVVTALISNRCTTYCVVTDFMYKQVF